MSSRSVRAVALSLPECVPMRDFAAGHNSDESVGRPDLTLVIPAYNEAQRLPKTLWAAREFLDGWGIDYRVLVVDDGSDDGTREIAELFGDRFSTLRLDSQQGKGGAVRAGMLRSTGRIAAFTDADLPFDLAALRAGYEEIESGSHEAVFGARDLEGAEDIASRKFSRKIASTVFRWIVSRMLGSEIKDTQCGLKVFRRDAMRAIFSRVTIKGFAFDAEVVYLAGKMKLRCGRVPVTLVNEHTSTLSLSRHALPMLRDVIAMRWKGGGDPVWSEHLGDFPLLEQGRTRAA